MPAVAAPSLSVEVPLVQIILDSPDQCGLPQGIPGPSPGSPPSETPGSGGVWSSGWMIWMACQTGLGACVLSVRGGPWQPRPEPPGCPDWVQSEEPGCLWEAGSAGCGLHWLCLLGLRSSWGIIQQLQDLISDHRAISSDGCRWTCHVFLTRPGSRGSCGMFSVSPPPPLVCSGLGCRVA